MLGHVAKSGVQFTAATANNVDAEGNGLALARRLQPLEEAAAYFCGVGNRRVAVAEQQRQRRLAAEGLTVVLNEFLYFHNILFWDKYSVFSPILSNFVV